MEDPMNRYDVLDTTDGGVDNAVEIAHAVSAKTAAELAGISAKLIEDLTLSHGELDLGATSFLPGEGFQHLWIRSTSDDSQDD
jgi:hypothetical protein